MRKFTVWPADEAVPNESREGVMLYGPDGQPINLGSGGVSGSNGESAYQIAVDNGFVGTEQEWLASLVGTPGTPGAPGGGLDWIEIAGHSLAGGGGARIVPHGGYAYRVKQALGINRVHDYAMGGAIACRPTAVANGDGGYGWILRQVVRPGSPGVAALAGSPYTPQSQLVIPHYGLNDLGALGAGNPLPFQSAYRTILSRFCAAAIFECDPLGTSASAWVETGAWTDLGNPDGQASTSGTGGRYTLTVGNKKTFTIPNDMPAGRVVAIGFFLNATQGQQTYGVRVLRGGNPLSGVSNIVAMSNQLTDQSVANMHTNYCARFGTGIASNANDPMAGQLLQPGDVIELTFLAGNSMCPDYAQIEADPADGPILACPLPNKPANYGIWSGGTWAGGASMNDAAVDAWKNYTRAVLAEFPQRVVSDEFGLGIDLDATPNTNRYTQAPGTNPAPAGVVPDFAADGAHPTDALHGKWGQRVEDVILASPLLTDRIRTRPFVDPTPRAWRKVGQINPAYAGSFAGGLANYANSTVPVFAWRFDQNRRVFVRACLGASTGVTNNITSTNSLPKPAGVVGKTGNAYDGTNWSQRAVRMMNTGQLQYAGALLSIAAGNLFEFDFDYQAEL